MGADTSNIIMPGFWRGALTLLTLLITQYGAHGGKCDGCVNNNGVATVTGDKGDACYAFTGECWDLENEVDECWFDSAFTYNYKLCWAQDEDSCCESNPGAVAGVVIACIIGCVCFCACGYFCYKKRREEQHYQQREHAQQPAQQLAQPSQPAQAAPMPTYQPNPPNYQA